MAGALTWTRRPVTNGCSLTQMRRGRMLMSTTPRSRSPSPHQGAETMTTASWEHLHDTTLVRLEVTWASGEALLHLNSSPEDVQIKATGLWRLEVPRHQPWSRSVSINGVKGFPLPDGKHHRLEIEMQSGDTIVLEAENFQLTEIEGSRRA